MPAGHPDGGQWTIGGGAAGSDTGGGNDAGGGINDPRILSDATLDDEWIPGARYAGNKLSGSGPAGSGNDQTPPLGEPPPIPPERPRTAQERNEFVKAAARWLATAVRVGRSVNAFVAAYEAMSWLDTDRPSIESYRDPPKTLEELQQAVLEPKRGYHTHHVVEQGPAEQDGYSRDQIDAPENLVRIPTIKHWEITGWFGRKNKDFGGRSPRDYLCDKDWSERV